MLERLIKKNYFLLISSFSYFIFCVLILVSGERGLISYIEKKELLSNLEKRRIKLTSKI